MKAKTAQQIFNKTWRYFIRDKNPQAINENNECQYRGRKSNCAIGCQLPDRLYHVEMENQGIEQVLKQFPAVESYFGPNNEDLLSSLQSAHDFHFMNLEKRLRAIAFNDNLKIPRN